MAVDRGSTWVNQGQPEIDLGSTWGKIWVNLHRLTTRSRYVESTDENAGINTAVSPPFVVIDSAFSSTVEEKAKRWMAKV
jgi:hypothetical protein